MCMYVLDVCMMSKKVLFSPMKKTLVRIVCKCVKIYIYYLFYLFIFIYKNWDENVQRRKNDKKLFFSDKKLFFKYYNKALLYSYYLYIHC